MRSKPDSDASAHNACAKPLQEPMPNLETLRKSLFSENVIGSYTEKSPKHKSKSNSQIASLGGCNGNGAGSEFPKSELVPNELSLQ